MKNSLFTLLFFFVSMTFIGCKMSKKSTFKKQMKESYFYSFKMIYFKKLLIQGFNNSPSINNIMLIDQSGYGENILSIKDYQIIDSLILIDNKIMLRDSIDRIGKVSEGAQGKQVFNYALTKYQSKRLDKFIEGRYKNHIKTSEND